MKQVIGQDFRDKEKINIHEAGEIEFWRRRFGVTSERLKKAIDRVGPKVKDVGSWIKHRGN